MTRLSLLIIGGLLAISVACINKQQSTADYDKAVMHEIFPALIDSIYVEQMFAMSPPPVVESYNSFTKKKTIKTINKQQSFKEELRKELGEYKKNHITIVLNDSIHPLSKDEIINFQSKYPAPEEVQKPITKSYEAELTIYKAKDVFHIVLASTFKTISKPRDSLAIILNELSFSRIIFNREKNRGMLTCEYVCGTLCGNGYRVFLRKNKNNWYVDYIEHSWIS